MLLVVFEPSLLLMVRNLFTSRNDSHPGPSRREEEDRAQ